MKRICKILAIIVSVSCVVNFSGCGITKSSTANAVNKPSITSGTSSEKNKSADTIINTDSNTDEVAAIADNSIQISENDSIEKIVETGYEKVEEYLNNEYANNNFQGVALVAVGNDIKFAKAYGFADENVENKLTTRFAIASNTKQFTAAAIMQLVEQGKINVDDTIDKYFPQFQYSNQITVKELLQMRSGLLDYLNDPQSFMQDQDSINILNTYKDYPYPDTYVTDSRWTTDLILKDLYLTPLVFTPGEEYSYCNTNYYLLGLIIEQASGMPYEEYIKKNLFQAADMTTASMSAENTDAKGHGSYDSGVIVVNSKFTFSAGNIYSNVYDMLRWLRNFHKGSIVSQQSYKEMTTAADESGYGYGLFINEDSIRHTGVIDGFNSYTDYNPQNDTTIIILENAGTATNPLEAKYDGNMIRGLIE